MEKNMIRSFIKHSAILLACLGIAGTTLAETKTYKIDSSHTYPAFEADHQGGLSLWRGKINSTTGTITLDTEAKSGTVNVEMDMSTIDFGHEGMNKSAKEKIFFTDKFPTATYSGNLTNFDNGEPTSVEGSLTLNGVTKPLTLDIGVFLCKPHYRTGKEICGADATATFNRGDYGVDYGLSNGFFPEVKLLISVEAEVQ